jgi:hypothetical protein
MAPGCRPTSARTRRSCTWHGRESVQRRGSKAICGICGGDLSKYTQASKRTTARSGKLIDVHPLLGERLQAGDEPIYFCLEGCLKADAVAGTGGLSISVLSVTLWQADEEPTHWALWLPILQRAPVVYVIPDSDYQPKPAWGAYEPGALPRYSKGGEVRYSTDRCVHWLRRYHSVNARFLVPPYLDRATAARSKVDNRFKIGIDDHIALGGNLSKWDIHSNPRGVHSWVYERSRYRNLPSSRNATAARGGSATTGSSTGSRTSPDSRAITRPNSYRTTSTGHRGPPGRQRRPASSVACSTSGTAIQEARGTATIPTCTGSPSATSCRIIERLVEQCDEAAGGAVGYSPRDGWGAVPRTRCFDRRTASVEV